MIATRVLVHQTFRGRRVTGVGIPATMDQSPATQAYQRKLRI